MNSVNAKEQARRIVLVATADIADLPRFGGQRQLLDGLRRLLNLSLWRA